LEVWVRRYIGFITISGSLLGITPLVRYFTQQLEPSQWILLVAICVFFTWSAFVGLLIVEGNKNRTVLIQALSIQLLQIPIISLPAITYQLASGIHLDLIYSTYYKGINLSIQFGSVSKFGFFEGGELVVAGANIAAIVAVFLIVKYIFPSQKIGAVELTS
jgi:hypothetical protein